MSLNTQFTACTEWARRKDLSSLLPKPSVNDALRVYGLYKQATEGDCTKAAPWVWQVQDKLKWDAHSKLKGMPQDEAKQKYIEAMVTGAKSVDTSSLSEKGKAAIASFLQAVGGSEDSKTKTVSGDTEAKGTVQPTEVKESDSAQDGDQEATEDAATDEQETSTDPAEEQDQEQQDDTTAEEENGEAGDSQPTDEPAEDEAQQDQEESVDQEQEQDEEEEDQEQEQEDDGESVEAGSLANSQTQGHVQQLQTQQGQGGTLLLTPEAKRDGSLLRVLGIDRDRVPRESTLSTLTSPPSPSALLNESNSSGHGINLQGSSIPSTPDRASAGSTGSFGGLGSLPMRSMVGAGILAASPAVSVGVGSMLSPSPRGPASNMPQTPGSVASSTPGNPATPSTPSGQQLLGSNSGFKAPNNTPSVSTSSSVLPQAKAIPNQLLAMQEENHMKLLALEQQLMRIVSRTMPSPQGPLGSPQPVSNPAGVATPATDAQTQVRTAKLQAELQSMMDLMESRSKQKELEWRQAEARWQQQLSQVEDLQKQLLTRLQATAKAAQPANPRSAAFESKGLGALDLETKVDPAESSTTSTSDMSGLLTQWDAAKLQKVASVAIPVGLGAWYLLRNYDSLKEKLASLFRGS